MKIFKAGKKTAADGSLLDIVSSLPDPLRYSLQSIFRRVKRHKADSNSVSLLPPAFNQLHITQACQGGFKGETPAVCGVARDFFQHEPSSPQGRRLRLKRRQPRSNQIRIHKDRASRLSGQKFPRQSRFAGPVRSCDDDDLFIGVHFPRRGQARVGRGYLIRRRRTRMAAPQKPTKAKPDRTARWPMTLTSSWPDARGLIRAMAWLRGNTCTMG